MEMTLNRKGRSPFQRIAPSTWGLSLRISCHAINNSKGEITKQSSDADRIVSACRFQPSCDKSTNSTNSDDEGRMFPVYHRKRYQRVLRGLYVALARVGTSGLIDSSPNTCTLINVHV